MTSLELLLESIDQQVLTVPSFELESGDVLRDVPVAYKTWGRLNDARDNVMVICHAFTGSADVEDWWGPLMGPNKAFDPTRYFVFCANVLGSPYGTASPITIDPETGSRYGPEFPSSTIRDDVRLHKIVLDHIGVWSIAVVIGGSMGGMAVLEWPLCFSPDYVRHIIPIATSARHSAWCISWGEAQRQSIYSDPAYDDGYYPPHTQPESGLAAARMAALLTYRSRDSFESRFGRKAQESHPRASSSTLTPPSTPPRPSSRALVAHNDGHRNTRSWPPSSLGSPTTSSPVGAQLFSSIFTAQSYLRYQGDKFVNRFDANCYIHITRKLDTHDVSRGRSDAEDEKALASVLSTVQCPALVIGIESDGLFMLSEQRELAGNIPNAELVVIKSRDGHDGFLLEFEQINTHILRFLRTFFPILYETGTVPPEKPEGFDIAKTSMFGEAEANVTMW